MGYACFLRVIVRLINGCLNRLFLHTMRSRLIRPVPCPLIRSGQELLRSIRLPLRKSDGLRDRLRRPRRKHSWRPCIATSRNTVRQKTANATQMQSSAIARKCGIFRTSVLRATIFVRVYVSLITRETRLSHFLSMTLAERLPFWVFSTEGKTKKVRWQLARSDCRTRHHLVLACTYVLQSFWLFIG